LPAKPLNSGRHSLARNLAAMQARGTITREMRRAGLDLSRVILSGSRPVIELIGWVGPPAGCCIVHVLGLGWSLKDWARQGWRGRPLCQETASGILVAALGILAHGEPRLLLDRALAEV
jgi:hypothetical protein